MITAEEMLKEHQHEIVSVSPNTTIREALKVMTKLNIGAILIKKGSEYVGIWTERDLMRNTLADGFNPETSLIKDFMTKKLHYANHDEEMWQLQDKFLGLRIRHLLVKKDDVFLGMVSSGDVTRHGLKEKTHELTELNKIVSWEYYENWRW